MKAAVLWELGKAPRCEEFSEPVASDGEALVSGLDVRVSLTPKLRRG